MLPFNADSKCFELYRQRNSFCAIVVQLTNRCLVSFGVYRVVCVIFSMWCYVSLWELFPVQTVLIWNSVKLGWSRHIKRTSAKFLDQPRGDKLSVDVLY